MIWFKAEHQASKSIRDFLARLACCILYARRQASPPPAAKLVIRVGAAGHLSLENETSVAFVVDAALAALRDYTVGLNARFRESMFPATAGDPVPELRLVSQLASGLDQIAAQAAHALGYCLHVVLPGSKAAFEHDIQRNAGSPQTPATAGVGPVETFRELIKIADRVLELDPADPEPGPGKTFVDDDYAQAGSVILSHTDILLVAVGNDAPKVRGGTRWMEEQAELLDLAIIHIPVERPSEALLIWTEEGRRQSRRLFNAASDGINPAVFEPALARTVLPTVVDHSKMRLGWFERGMTAQLDPAVNARYWDKRWMLRGSSTSLTMQGLGRVQAGIDSDLKSVRVWADNRASAFAELVRGSFIFCAVLGAVAVAGALIGILWPRIARPGKVIEIVCLLVILWFIQRSKRFNWRSQWLRLRELERCIDQAAWLLLLGRTRNYTPLAHLRGVKVDDCTAWCQAYLRAMLRSACVPHARLDPDYINTAHQLMLHNYVGDQRTYYRDEAVFNQKSDAVMERNINRSVSVALVMTSLYLMAHWLEPWLDCPISQFGESLKLTPLIESFKTYSTQVVTVLGALMPATAAALSAIRHHGEYAQIALQYENTAAALQGVEYKLVSLLPDRRNGTRQPRSSILHALMVQATDATFQEIQGWSAVLQKKEIEPA
jgi:hypothetical protein